MSAPIVPAADIDLTRDYLRKWLRSALAKGNAETAGELKHVMRTFSRLYAEARDKVETVEMEEPVEHHG